MASTTARRSVVWGRPVLLRGGHEWCYQGPLLVGHIACVESTPAFIIRASDFSPHPVPPCFVRHKRVKHGRLKSLNIVSNQTLRAVRVGFELSFLQLLVEIGRSSAA